MRRVGDDLWGVGGMTETRGWDEPATGRYGVSGGSKSWSTIRLGGRTAGETTPGANRT